MSRFATIQTKTARFDRVEIVSETSKHFGVRWPDINHKSKSKWKLATIAKADITHGRYYQD